MALYVIRNFADEPVRRPTLLSQLGLDLAPEDFVTPLTISAQPIIRGRNYCPWILNKKDSGSTVTSDKDKFEVNLDVQQFTPEEINVKVVDNSVVVEGKHEEKEDEHGFISRHFVRKYVLPKEYELKNVQSSLSSDGVLTISAPKCQENQERIIPITHTGPHKTQEKESKEEKQEQN